MVDINAFRSRPDWMSGKARLSGMTKHPGNKNKPHYNAIMRAAQMLAGTTGLDDPASGAGGFLLGMMPTGQVNMNDYDSALMNVMRQIQGTEGGLVIPYSRYGGAMDKPTWNSDIRGSTITRINRGELPQEGSMNYYMHKIRQGIPLTPDEEREFAIMYLMNKQTGFQGGIRTETGYNNYTPGSLKRFTDAQDISLAQYQPLFANANLRTGDAADALREWDINDMNLLGADMPYMNEPSTYGIGFDTGRFVSALSERNEEGQPIVAFDSMDAADLYRDIGLDVEQIMRYDGTNPDAAKRGYVPEMVATNIEGLSPRNVLQGFGYHKNIPQQQKDLLDWTTKKSADPFDYGWAVLKGSQ